MKALIQYWRTCSEHGDERGVVGSDCFVLLCYTGTPPVPVVTIVGHDDNREFRAMGRPFISPLTLRKKLSDLLSQSLSGLWKFIQTKQNFPWASLPRK